MLKIISVFIGGGLGAILRFLATKLSVRIFSSPVYGTFAVNILGCFLIGLVFGFILNKTENISDIAKVFVTAGFLGGLTTFSTFNFEVFELLKSGKVSLGLFYIFASCFAGLICTYFGYLISSKM